MLKVCMVLPRTFRGGHRYYVSATGFTAFQAGSCIRQPLHLSRNMPDKTVKEGIRRRLEKRRRQLSVDEVLRSSRALCARLLALPEVVAAPMIAMYMAFDGEIDVNCIYSNRKREGKGVLLPRHNRRGHCYELVEIKDLEAQTRTGYYGIREPLRTLPALPAAKQNSADLTWLVPAVAFDPTGHRLGRGGGYYDRLLEHCNGCKIGVGYDWQIVDNVPVTPRDIGMDLVITDGRAVDCRLAA